MEKKKDVSLLTNDEILQYGINEELLYYNEDDLWYNDEPFTGIGYSLYSNGNLESVTFYEKGFAYGVSREWYENNQLKSEFELKRGCSNGKEVHWYSNGSVKSIGNYEFGIELDYMEWDETGNLIENRKLDINDSKSNYRALLKFREREKEK